MVSTDLTVWSVWTLQCGQCRPYSVVSVDLTVWSVRTLQCGQSGPYSVVSADLTVWSETIKVCRNRHCSDSDISVQILMGVVPIFSDRKEYLNLNRTQWECTVTWTGGTMACVQGRRIAVCHSDPQYSLCPTGILKHGIGRVPTRIDVEKRYVIFLGWRTAEDMRDTNPRHNSENYWYHLYKPALNSVSSFTTFN